MGKFTREAVGNIIANPELTEEQKREQIFTLYGSALDEGYVSRRQAEEMKTQAIEATKAEFKVPDPVDPKTTPEYIELQTERDMLRTIGGEDFAHVKPKFREQVFGMLDRSEKAPAIADQLNGLREKWEEMFVPAETPNNNQQKNTPQYSQNQTGDRTNPKSEEDKIFEALS